MQKKQDDKQEKFMPTGADWAEYGVWANEQDQLQERLEAQDYFDGSYPDSED
ncbi:MAG: hypothetical protein HC924_18420 [Synechococcaceae cyanobacterium SM2_3_2]|nr:hypothetical protein [Synechococcaceae cyanobacterium SM2_3_2]